MKISILTLFLFGLNQLCLAQEPSLGIINDPDGYTNIRAGKGTSNEIVDRIQDFELFAYFDEPDEQWLRVTVVKCVCDGSGGYSKDVKGYIHRSRILDLSQLNSQQTKEFLKRTFEKELELFESRSNLTDRQSIEFRTASNRWVVYHEMVFDMVLDTFSDHICTTKDDELFKLYNKIITTEDGSADELPSFAIGRIFKCQPAWTLERIPKSHSYFHLLEWGCQGVTDKEHQRLLNEHRTNIGLEQVDYDNYEY